MATRLVVGEEPMSYRELTMVDVIEVLHARNQLKVVTPARSLSRTGRELPNG